MKTLSDYMKMSYRVEVIEDFEEGGFVASCPELPGCISSGATLEEAYHNLQDAKKVWLEVALQDNLPIPIPLADNQYSGQFKLRIPKSLHRQLAEHSKDEGISMNQYCLYLLAMNDAVHFQARNV